MGMRLTAVTTCRQGCCSHGQFVGKEGRRDHHDLFSLKSRWIENRLITGVPIKPEARDSSHWPRHELHRSAGEDQGSVDEVGGILFRPGQRPASAGWWRPATGGKVPFPRESPRAGLFHLGQLLNEVLKRTRRLLPRLTIPWSSILVSPIRVMRSHFFSGLLDPLP